MSFRSLPRFTRDLRVLHGGRDERIADMTTMNDEKWTELQQAEDMAYFKADICLCSPESYTLDEKREICNEMVSTSKAVLDAMRADCV